MAILGFVIYVNSGFPILFWSKRMGVNDKIYLMPKFRSMKNGAPNVATESLKDVSSWITPIGYFMRMYSIDELPQLWSVLIGDMSFVGPRPALFNQYELIELRKAKGLNLLRPGITGLAQISGRDNLTLIEKVEADYEYAANKSFYFDLKILILTVPKVWSKQNITH